MAKTTHILREVETVLGVEWSKQTRSALAAFERAQDMHHKANRMVGAAEAMLREWRAEEKIANVERALATDPEDFISYRVTNPPPDPDYLRTVGGIYAKALSRAQVGIEQTVKDTAKAYGQIEAAWLKIASEPSPETQTVVEHAAATARVAEALRVAVNGTLWLAAVDGINEAEARLIRGARGDGSLMSFQAARDIRSGRTPARLAAAERAAGTKAETAKRLAAEAAANAKSRKGGGA